MRVPPPRRGFTPAFAILVGGLIGTAVFVVGFGTLISHTECVPGPELGWSGPVNTPTGVYVPPPGGQILYQGSVGNGSWATTVPEWNTTAEFSLFNWTLRDNLSVEVAGTGPSISCPSTSLSASSLGHGCAGCELAPGVPAGVGERVALPARFEYAGNSSTIFNASYPPSPIGNFTWHATVGGVASTESTALLNADLAFASNGTTLVIHTSFAGYGFGVPIHLLNGGTTTITGAFDEENWLTYLFPPDSDQGTWNVYAAGGSGAFAIGGYLFVQTAAT
jgi:hypothetical protein